MVDPTGLVALGLDGAGRVLKIKKRRDRWKESLCQLSLHLDEAHRLLHSSAIPMEDAVIYQDVLNPLICDAIEVLERARTLKGLSAARHFILHAKDDTARANTIIDMFKSAPGEIESRRIARDARLIRADVQTVIAHSKRAVDYSASLKRMLVVSITIYTAAFL